MYFLSRRILTISLGRTTVGRLFVLLLYGLGSSRLQILFLLPIRIERFSVTVFLGLLVPIYLRGTWGGSLRRAVARVYSLRVRFVLQLKTVRL